MALISSTVGYSTFIGIVIIICGLYVAKSWLHKKCKTIIMENDPTILTHTTATSNNNETPSTSTTSNADNVNKGGGEITKNQQYFTSQIFPEKTLKLQVYVTTIDHFINSIRTPLTLIAITILLYTYPRSELVTNYLSSSYSYNIIFHSFQLLTLITFYFVSNIDPGIIKPHPAPNGNGNTDNDKYKEIKPTQHAQEEKTETTQLLRSQQQQQQQRKISQSSSSTADTAGNELNVPLMKMFGAGRYQHIYVNNDGNKSDVSSHAIEIECEWNNDSTVPISYCYNCYFLHPIRAKHCYEIGFCVARYDHYCRLIENAVGANNLRYVMVHLLLESMIYVWMLCMVVYIIILNIGNKDSNVIGWILIILLCFYLLITSLTRTIHLFDHIQTISKNQTISEKVDPQRTVDVLNDGYHDYDEDDREIDYHDRYFDEGFFKNWFLCFSAYKENKEYFNGIKCKLMFEDDDDNAVFIN